MLQAELISANAAKEALSKQIRVFGNQNGEIFIGLERYASAAVHLAGGL